MLFIYLKIMKEHAEQILIAERCEGNINEDNHKM